jgi:hypothetical protein
MRKKGLKIVFGEEKEPEENYIFKPETELHF